MDVAESDVTLILISIRISNRHSNSTHCISMKNISLRQLAHLNIQSIIHKPEVPTGVVPFCFICIGWRGSFEFEFEFGRGTL